jgi:hypothetical protein
MEGEGEGEGEGGKQSHKGGRDGRACRGKNERMWCGFEKKRRRKLAKTKTKTKKSEIEPCFSCVSSLPVVFFLFRFCVVVRSPPPPPSPPPPVPENPRGKRTRCHPTRAPNRHAPTPACLALPLPLLSSSRLVSSPLLSRARVLLKTSCFGLVGLGGSSSTVYRTHKKNTTGRAQERGGKDRGCWQERGRDLN